MDQRNSKSKAFKKGTLIKAEHVLKSAAPVFFAAAFSAALIFTASGFETYAAAPGQFSLMDDETYAKLMDDTVEWEEIGNLVMYFNPAYRIYADSADGSNAEITQACDEFRAEMQDSIDKIDDNLDIIEKQRRELSNLPGQTVIDESGTTASQAVAMLDMSSESLRAGRKQIKEGMREGSRLAVITVHASETALEPVREQITQAVEGLVVSYNEMVINRALVAKQVSLYETMLGTRTALRAKGLSTEAEVMSAGAALENARTTLKRIDNGLGQLGTAIGLQLGWPADRIPEIMPVPAPSVSFPDTADKDADFAAALANSRTYESAGKIKSYTGGSAILQRDAALNEANALASSEFDRLYLEMKKQKLLYDAAQTSLQRAAISRERAERMYLLGMTSRAEYEGMQTEYISFEASAKLSALSLFKAINDYMWAVRGYFTY